MKASVKESLKLLKKLQTRVEIREIGQKHLLNHYKSFVCVFLSLSLFILLTLNYFLSFILKFVEEVNIQFTCPHSVHQESFSLASWHQDIVLHFSLIGLDKNEIIWIRFILVVLRTNWIKLLLKYDLITSKCNKFL